MPFARLTANSSFQTTGVINRPNPTSGDILNAGLVYGSNGYSPNSGPALTFSSLSRICTTTKVRSAAGFSPLGGWSATQANLKPEVCWRFWRLRSAATAEDFLAYLAGRDGPSGLYGALSGRPDPTRLADSPDRPAKFFDRSRRAGPRVIWLHRFGERFADPKAGRPRAPPPLPTARRPPSPRGAIPDDASHARDVYV